MGKFSYHNAANVTMVIVADFVNLGVLRSYLVTSEQQHMMHYTHRKYEAYPY